MDENVTLAEEARDVSMEDMYEAVHNMVLDISSRELERAYIDPPDPADVARPAVERMRVSGSELHRAFDALRGAVENTARAAHDMSVDVFADSGDGRRHDPFAHIPDAAEFLREYRTRFHGGYDDGMTLDELAQVVGVIEEDRLAQQEPDTTELDEGMSQAFEEVFNG